MNTREKLNALADLQAAALLLTMKKQELIDSILTPEIKQQLAEIEMEFADQLEAVNTKITALEAEIKPEIIAIGASVKGDYIQAVYTKPRVTWDNKMLEGIAAVIPQVAQARKEGQPSVSFRKV